MTLPRELRDQICTHAILTPDTPPSITQSTEALLASRVQFKTPKLRAWSDVVYYEPNAPNKASTSLLQVCKQLRAETQTTLANIAANPTSYALDLILLNETDLLPSWTSVPVATTRVNTVDVAFRISGAYDRKKRHPYQGFAAGCGAGPAIGWNLYAVLERFLRVGARGETHDEDTHMHVTANCIRIDVQTPAGVAAERFGGPRSGRLRRQKGEDETMLDPGYLASFVEENLGDLLTGGNFEWFVYGRILYEHVGEIVVCKDGVEVRRWDVAEQLRELGNIPERHYSAEQLRWYKESAWRVRRERGLKVLDQ